MSTVTTDQVEKVVYDALEEIGPSRDQLKREATFEELDVDSLDLAEVSQVVEEEFGVTLKGDDVEHLKTIGDAIDLIHKRATA
ncbi:MAG: phosphopantetheine-binding protein [Actinomycetota bacterium]|nr:phosphopantetheine-binding protein [Actinomycetota bacterium]